LTESQNFERSLLCPASEDEPRNAGMADDAEADLAAIPDTLESAAFENIVAGRKATLRFIRLLCGR